MINATPLIWLEENHPAIYKQYLEFRKEWRREARRDWWHANKVPSKRPPGRPRKLKNTRAK